MLLAVVAMDDVPIRPGVGRDGKPQTFEELLARKLSNPQRSTTSVASQRSSPSRNPSSSNSDKPAKRVSFTQSTRSPLPRPQRTGEGSGGSIRDQESKESSRDGSENLSAEDEVDEYRRIEETLRALRVEAEVDAMGDSKYDDDDKADSSPYSTADLIHTRDSASGAAPQADKTNDYVETGDEDNARRADDTTDRSDEEEGADESSERIPDTQSAEQRLRRQRMEVYNSYARSAKPLKTKREDNPDTLSDYQHSPPSNNSPYTDDVGIVHASAISPAIAQLFFQPPSSVYSPDTSASPALSSPSLPAAGHSRGQSTEWSVGSGYGKGRARVSVSEKPASKQTGKRLQPHRANQYLTLAANTPIATISTAPNRTSSASASTPVVTNSQSLPSALHAQLNALQHEMSQYQAERSRLATLQHETQRELHLIKQERQQLTGRLQQQKADWDKQRTEQEKRLKRDRLELERRKREAMGWKGSVREERGRVEELEEEAARREKEWKEREGRYRATIERMRREMREMQAEVKEAREREMREEKKRVEEWERREKDREKDKDADRRRKSAPTSHYQFATVTAHTRESSAAGTALSPSQRSGSSTKMREIVARHEQQEADEDEKYSTHDERQSIASGDASGAAVPRSPHTANSSPAVHSHSPPHSSSAAPSPSVPLPAATSIVSTVRHPANKTEHILSDRSRLVLFADGTRKHIGVDGSTRVDFPNGDYKVSTRHTAHGQPHTVYYYASRRVLHRSYEGKSGGGSSGAMDEYVFEDGQMERHWKDGRKDIQFADGSRKTIDAQGRQTTVWPDDDVKDGTEHVDEGGVGIASTRKWAAARSNGARGVSAGR